jgi:hypothetical protein
VDSTPRRCGTHGADLRRLGVTIRAMKVSTMLVDLGIAADKVALRAADTPIP